MTISARPLWLATGLILITLMFSSATANAVEITNIRSGLKADVWRASTAPNTGVILWPDNTSLSQEFDLLDSGNGFFRIRARHSGQCLMLDWNQGNRNGTRVMQYHACHAGYAPAEWRRGWVSVPQECNGGSCTSTSTQSPVLINRHSGRCLDANNGSGGAPPQSAVLQQWDCIRTATDWNAGNQLWRIGTESYL